MEQWSREQWEQNIQQHDQTAFFLYTPMCGTCELSERMLKVVEKLLPDLPLGMANINYIEGLANDLKIESVPCLIVSDNGKVSKKLYAFKSVPFLYEILKK
ncbi:thioredoxin family protein [Solibacillus sp. A46]|uniref:Thioredoxin family protein n=1 Tax=Solibacillus faecavium TaxID=2762221 RepID=A0ABR8XY41_9BACL|nr:thioredoxin family protein [Solibacillus faecavium]MBD8036853.1 thioredoxin family protein [Solibacillus faecavium]